MVQAHNLVFLPLALNTLPVMVFNWGGGLNFIAVRIAACLKLESQLLLPQLVKKLVLVALRRRIVSHSKEATLHTQLHMLVVLVATCERGHSVKCAQKKAIGFHLLGLLKRASFAPSNDILTCQATSFDWPGAHFGMPTRTGSSHSQKSHGCSLCLVPGELTAVRLPKESTKTGDVVAAFLAAFCPVNALHLGATVQNGPTSTFDNGVPI